jgi:hypothetical protein
VETVPLAAESADRPDPRAVAKGPHRAWTVIGTVATVVSVLIAVLALLQQKADGPPVTASPAQPVSSSPADPIMLPVIPAATTDPISSPSRSARATSARLTGTSPTGASLPPSPHYGPDLLSNPGFNIGGTSSANGWTAIGNSGPVTTELRTSTGPEGGMMLRVCAPADSGIAQSGITAGGAKVHTTVWVYVESGRVGVGVGAGGGLSLTDFADATPSWQIIATDQAQLPAAEIVIYSVPPYTSCYDIDYAAVQTRS